MATSKKTPNLAKTHDLDKQVSRMMMYVSLIGIAIFILISPKIMIHSFASELLLLHLIGVISFSISTLMILMTYSNKYLDYVVSNVSTKTKSFSKLKKHIKRLGLFEFLFRNEFIRISFIIGFISLVSTAIIFPYDYNKDGVTKANGEYRLFCDPNSEKSRRKCSRR